MRMLAYAAATLMVAFMATACGNKDGGGGAVAVVPTGVGAQSCTTGCGNLTGLVASALGKSYTNGSTEQAAAGLQFYGDPNIIAASQAQGSQTRYYRGSAVMGGVIHVKFANAEPGACVIPAGDYVIQTQNQPPGQWSREEFGNMMVTAVGPVTLQIQVYYGMISGTTPAAVDPANGQTYPFIFRSEFYVLSSSGGGYCSPTDPYTGRRLPQYTF